MNDKASELPTVGSIARRFGVSTHKVEYVIETRGINPIGRAGNARVFSEASVRHIGSELHRIAEDREGTRDD